MKKKVKRILLMIICLVISFLLFYFKSLPSDREIKESTQYEIIENEKSISFVPKKMDRGLVIYPGARVRAKSYSYIAEELAKKGIFTSIIKMPINFAIFDYTRGFSIVDEYKEIDKWYIAGHSLGGASAALAVEKNPNVFDKIIFLASYSSVDLSDLPINVLTISGELDGLATALKIEKNKKNLPYSSKFFEIKGANHTQFGYYNNFEVQRGDNKAQISREEQQDIIIDLIYNFIK